MSKHSAGPWTKCTANDGKCKCGIIWDGTGSYGVALVLSSDDDDMMGGECTPDEDEFQANKDLIAAAPQMAATGKAFLDCIEGDRHMRAELDTNQVAAFLEFRAALDAAGVQHA